MILEDGPRTQGQHAVKYGDADTALPARPYLELDGGAILHEENPRPLTPDMHGEFCVVWLADGSVLAKRPMPGETPGRFDLYAFGSATRFDCEVVKAALVVETQSRAYVRRKNNTPPGIRAAFRRGEERRLRRTG